MAAGPRSTRAWKLVGAVAATAAALGGAVVALPSAHAATVVIVEGAAAKEEDALKNAMATCHGMGGEPTDFVKRVPNADHTAFIATITCTVP